MSKNLVIYFLGSKINRIQSVVIKLAMYAFADKRYIKQPVNIYISHCVQVHIQVSDMKTNEQIDKF